MINFQLEKTQGATFVLENILKNNAEQYNGSAFALVLAISETIILPIAGVIFAYVVINELIQLQVAQNNMHENVVLDLYKWMFKTFLGIMLISNSFTIANAIIEVGATVIGQVIPLIESEGNAISISATSDLLELEIFQLASILISTVVVNIVSNAGGLLVRLFVVARFFEIYMYLMVAPIPFASLTSQQLSQSGLNYIKNIISLALQGLIIVVSFSLYTAIATTLTMESVITGEAGVFGTGIAEGLVLILVLVVMVWRSRSIAQSLVGSH